MYEDPRSNINLLAQRLKLKTKSHGENEQRQLVVFKILTPPEIVEMLLRCGGENDKYLLVPPHTEESKSPSNEQASANQTEGDRENNVSVQPVASHSTNDNSTSPISSLSVQVNDQQKVCEIESKDASVCDSDCEDDSNSDSDATYTEDIVNESDIDVIDRVMNNKLAAVNHSVKLYNHLIQQQYQGKKFTKKERKKYFKHKKFLLNRGIVLKDVTSVKYFKLEDYLVDVNSINVVTASNLPKSCPNKKHHKKILKANSAWHSEITGLQVLREKPELISKDIREVIQQLKMEEAKKLKIYKLGKNLRRKIKLFVRTIGAKTLYN